MKSVSESKVVGMEQGEDIGKSGVIFETRISSGARGLYFQLSFWKILTERSPLTI